MKTPTIATASVPAFKVATAFVDHNSTLRDLDDEVTTISSSSEYALQSTRVNGFRDS